MSQVDEGVVTALVSELFDAAVDLMEAVQQRGNIKALAIVLAGKLTRLRHLQRHVKKPDAPRSDPKRDMKPLLAWWKAETGVSEEEAAWRVGWSANEGHGLWAQRDVSKDETVLSVPVKTMMTVRTALESRAALLIHADEMLQQLHSAVIALQLVVERYNLNSYWAGYIASLPKNYPTALQWTEQEWALLESSSLAVREGAGVLAQAARLYAHLYFRLKKEPALEQAVIKRASFTWEVYSWAFATIESRRNNNVLLEVAREDGKRPETLALIPLFDLLNHTVNPEDAHVVAQFNVEKQALELIARKDIKKDEEILLFYGARPNMQLLAHQGFCVKPNPYNLILLPFNLLESDKLAEKKAQALLALQLPPSAIFAVNSKDLILPPMMAYVRVAVATTEEELSKAGEALKGPLSPQNEARALNILNLRLEQIRMGYEKSEKDHATQEKENMHNYLVACMHQCMSEELSIIRRAQEQIRNRKMALEKK